jgi:hypothetical protein
MTNSGHREGQASAGPQCRVSPPHRIIVVDDQTAIQRLITAALVGSSYDEESDRIVL